MTQIEGKGQLVWLCHKELHAMSCLADPLDWKWPPFSHMLSTCSSHARTYVTAFYMSLPWEVLIITALLNLCLGLALQYFNILCFICLSCLGRLCSINLIFDYRISWISDQSTTQRPEESIVSCHDPAILSFYWDYEYWIFKLIIWICFITNYLWKFCSTCIHLMPHHVVKTILS